MEPTTDSVLPTASADTVPDASALLKASRMFVYVGLTSSVLTMIINPLTVIAMALHGMLRKSATNLFIASLCCADLITGAALFLVKLQELMTTKHSDAEAKFTAVISWTAAALTVMGFFSSLFTAFAIGVDRAVATITPMKYRSRMTHKRGIISLVIMWTSVGCLVLTPLAVKLNSLEKEQPLPVITHPPLAFPQPFIQYVCTPLIGCCLIGNALLYLSIVIAFNRFSRTAKSSSSTKHSQQLTKMSVILVSSLLVSITPITIFAALPPPAEPLEQLRANLMYNALMIIMLVPTFSNNFIYAWHQRDFRKAFSRLLKCEWRNATVHPTQFTEDPTRASTQAKTVTLPL
ncbi:hypothetical protein CAPTEDRAFT_212807 [Capitella teleta]|uniref:G-protein coupled receptors family 1 profile domain-containing protein n=1 Tax=Capitella teleta TaxID=283909 RepID=R7T797_CAPTE|nr:hypothetical protein CAPTEDRAFT_212807 [Capitella teleta]|eukprot:ELT89263.1 hypothetical protein CAPTEDRAFT_212807 [Capitella teleta]